jgi:hypothetical protein
LESLAIAWGSHYNACKAEPSLKAFVGDLKARLAEL